MFFAFAAQPPELISAKIYSGPGTESLQAAAAAWDGLSSELQSTAANYQSIISGLVSGDWTGPSSEAAAAAVAVAGQHLRPVQRCNCGLGGRVRPILGPGCRRHHRLLRIVTVGHDRPRLAHSGTTH